MTKALAKRKATKQAPAKKAARKTSVSKTTRLFTIGYQQTTPKAVLDELENAGVKLLIDVRAVAASRRPGFSKRQLSAGLNERGIGYLHFQALGTPTEGRLAARSGDQKALTSIYAKQLKTQHAKHEIAELNSLIETAGPVCILCYERDHRECHRRFIAEIIEERGVTIENLLAPQL